MWDGKSVDEIRILRNSIKADKLHLQCAPLGPRQKKRLQEEIARQKAELKQLNAQKRAEKKLAKEGKT
jgi:hypothetical protein